jgi:glycosyltransferase involved in cell wall biosynthesis
MTNIKFSLILCTINRTRELEYFLHHAKSFTIKDFEVIIADQNNDDRVDKIIEKLGDIHYSIKHIKTPKGLSKSRNVALNYTKGDIIGFPDDDCFYEKDTLEKIWNFLIEYPDYSVMIAKWINPDKNGFQPHEKFYSHELVNYKEIFSFMSIGIFIRKKDFLKIGKFDESLGLGSDTIFKGGEDYDILLRAYTNGFKIYYNSECIIYHPWKGISNKSDKETIKNYYKAIKYAGASDFYVMNKNLPKKELIKIIINNCLATIFYLFTFRKILFLTHLHRLLGFLIAIKFIYFNGNRSKKY